MYLIGDVSNEGYKAYTSQKLATKPTPVQEDFKTIMAKRAVFQSVASMGLPMVVIHSVVKYSGQAMKDVKNPKLRTWGPIGLGLSVVPALPYMFDHPVETAVEYVFDKGFELAGNGGKEAQPTTPTQSVPKSSVSGS